jgi:hypothetical protein
MFHLRCHISDKNEKYWLLFPSYRYEREHLRPQYGILIHDQWVRMHVCLYEREEILVRNVIIQNMLVGLTSNKRMVEMKENGKLAEMR